MWGQASTTIVGISAIGIIPTRVGTRSATGTDTRTDKDHPHACGDKLTISTVTPATFGIIPTRVGTRLPSLPVKTHDRDHPHACGDKAIAGRAVCAVIGSSPRVWGQANKICGGDPVRRIIPTRVGTRNILKTPNQIRWDHPHACGDKRNAYDYINNLTGSSPRVWGQVSIFAFEDKHKGSSPRVWGQALLYSIPKSVNRIIPTRVGTSRHIINTS